MKTDLRKKFIDSATQLFAKEGFEKVTIRKIANRAGGNTAMISYYFGNKAGLYLEVLRSLFCEYDNKLKSIIKQRKRPINELKDYFIVVHDLYNECPFFTAIIAHEGSNPSEEFKKALLEHEKHFEGDYLFNLLKKGMVSGDIRQDIDPEYMARILSLLANYFQIPLKLLSVMCPECDSNTDIYFSQVSKMIFSGLAGKDFANQKEKE